MSKSHIHICLSLIRVPRGKDFCSDYREIRIVESLSYSSFQTWRVKIRIREVNRKFWKIRKKQRAIVRTLRGVGVRVKAHVYWFMTSFCFSKAYKGGVGLKIEWPLRWKITTKRLRSLWEYQTNIPSNRRMRKSNFEK